MAKPKPRRAAPVPDFTARPASAPDRFIETGQGLVWGGSSHGGLPDSADWGPMRYYRLVAGYGPERKLATLIRWDVSKVAFARWVPTGPDQGSWVNQPSLIDYVHGDEQGRAEEVNPAEAFAFIAAGAAWE
jgi:hypothetical protein